MTSTSKQYITSILDSLNSIEAETTTTNAEGSASILTRLSGPAAEQAKAALLTLHFLFPHELLPALDLLDRKLVTKLSCPLNNEAPSSPDVFYVQSASAVTEAVSRNSSARFRNKYQATKAHYEVRLDSWNCSCAAFAQSQLKLLLADIELGSSRSEAEVVDNCRSGGEAWYGGTETKMDAMVPICKHILAASIATAGPALFNVDVQNKVGSREEVAAWSAGWGEI